MKRTAITQRLTGLGGAKWAIHRLARQLASQLQFTKVSDENIIRAIPRTNLRAGNYRT